MEEFIQEFREDAGELIIQLEQNVMSLENDPVNKDLITKIFRAMHTLKGVSGMFGFEIIGDFTHDLENIYEYIRDGEARVTGQILEMTFQSVDHLKNLLKDPELNEIKNKINHQRLTAEIKKTIQTIEKSFNPENQDQEYIASGREQDQEEYKTYFVSFTPDQDVLEKGIDPLSVLEGLDELGQLLFFPDLNKIKELSEKNPEQSLKTWNIFIASQQGINAIIDQFFLIEDSCRLKVHILSEMNLLNQNPFVGIISETFKNRENIAIEELKDLVAELEKIFINGKQQAVPQEPASKEMDAISSIRVSSDKIDDIMNLVSELVTTQARLKLIAGQNQIPSLTSVTKVFQKLSRELRDKAFSISLVSLGSMLPRFKRMVRDISGELGKKVEFIAEGTDTELGKNLIENLSNPIMHIIRNSLDHGIEDEQTRVALGKPKQGNIIMRAFYSGANVVIQIEDDGKGIDPDKVKEKAIEKNLIKPEIQLSDKEAYDLIFLPGFTTTDQVSELSGRGVGMDRGKKKISEMLGDNEIDSAVKQATPMSSKLPLSLSIIDGLLVKTAGIPFIIPLTVVHKIFKAENSEIENAFNDLIVLDGKQITFHYLRKEFNKIQDAPETHKIVVVNYQQQQIGLVVDEIIGEYQAVLQPLGKYFKNQELFSGATILGDGSVALVLDTHKMIREFAQENYLVDMG